MQTSPIVALRELEPILREIEAERSQQVHRVRRRLPSGAW
jgi:hypothetical protein